MSHHQDKAAGGGAPISAPEAAIRERVLAIIGRTFQLPKSELSPEMTFEELGADSADVTELEVVLLEEFALEIPREEVREWRCVGDLLRFVLTARGTT